VLNLVSRAKCLDNAQVGEVLGFGALKKHTH
jgi:hypothetical protein